MQITLDIPDEMARNLESRKEDLPQILALELREIIANPSTGFSGLTEILEFLAKLPSPEEILALRLSPMVQAEIDSLLDKNRTQGLDESDVYDGLFGVAVCGNIMSLLSIWYVLLKLKLCSSYNKVHEQNLYSYQFTKNCV
ncbi:hypothetical protein [Nostoc sp.]